LTLADALVPGRSLARELGLVGLFVGITAAAAQVRIPLPFTPVPITGQTFAVLLCGATLGARRGAFTLLVYLLLGAAGLPIFAEAKHGLPFLLPTGGYLVGFIPAAYLIGFLVERGWDRQMGKAALALVLGNAVLYVFGVAWLAVVVGGVGRAVAKGFLPFLIGDAIKLVLAAALLPGAWKWVGRGEE
jgi:biotin transport system substrate-specific component